jgi:hypothetical protein
MHCEGALWLALCEYISFAIKLIGGFDCMLPRFCMLIMILETACCFLKCCNHCEKKRSGIINKRKHLEYQRTWPTKDT